MSDLTALLQAPNGWDAKALAWAKAMSEQGEDPYETYKKLFIAGGTGKITYEGPNEGGAGGGPPPDMSQNAAAMAT